jgi:hypothetical protein
MVCDINLGFGIRYTSRIHITYQDLNLYCMPNIELYRIRKPRFIPYTKAYIYPVYQNLYLYRIQKPRIIPYTKTYIYTVYQNLYLV